MVKYTGTSTLVASGNGGRSTGIGVMPMRVTGRPSSPRTIVFGGRCSSRPGMYGVVTVISFLVGDGSAISFATSSRGIQIVNGSVFVAPDVTENPYSKKP